MATSLRGSTPSLHRSEPSLLTLGYQVPDSDNHVALEDVARKHGREDLLDACSGEERANGPSSQKVDPGENVSGGPVTKYHCWVTSDSIIRKGTG